MEANHLLAGIVLENLLGDQRIKDELHPSTNVVVVALGVRLHPMQKDLHGRRNGFEFGRFNVGANPGFLDVKNAR